MVAALLTETGLSLLDLPHLTDRQIHALYYHPRDREGKVVPSRAVDLTRLPDRGEVATEEEAARVHFTVGKAFGISREKLEAAWLENHATIPPGV